MALTTQRSWVQSHGTYLETNVWCNAMSVDKSNVILTCSKSKFAFYIALLKVAVGKAEDFF